MLKFEQGWLLFYSDIERCPYSIRDSMNLEWSRKDDKRLLLIALERYLVIYDYLRNTHQYLWKEEKHK